MISVNPDCSPNGLRVGLGLGPMVLVGLGPGLGQRGWGHRPYHGVKVGQGPRPKQAWGCLYRTTSIQICPQTKILHTNSTSNTSTTQTYSQDRTHKEKPISQLYYCNEHNHCHYQSFDQLHFTPKPSQTSSKKVTWAIEMCVCVCARFFFFNSWLWYLFWVRFDLDIWYLRTLWFAGINDKMYRFCLGVALSF